MSQIVSRNEHILNASVLVELYDTEFLVVEDKETPLSARPGTRSASKARIGTANTLDVTDVLRQDDENSGPKLQFPLFKEVFLLNEIVLQDT